MNVCPDCFAVKGLQRRIIEIRKDYDAGRCDFHPTKKGVPIEGVAQVVDPVFRDNYGGAIPDFRSPGPRGDDLEEVLGDLTQAEDDAIIDALRDALIEADDYWPGDGEEPFYDDDYKYYRDRHHLGETTRLWREFRRGLMHGQRFFNSEAKALLTRIFRDVHHQRDAAKQGPVYLVRPGEPQSMVFRARITQDEGERDRIEKRLAEELGPPPERKRKAGRLNPAGVIAFYAAFDLDTCVAELRPSVGAVVMAAEFAIGEPICVLDMTRFDAQPKAEDLYAKNARERAAQWSFMQSFMNEIAQPISPGDEHLDYLPTQAVAEYLNKHHTFTFEGRERTIDAIIYRSAQHPEGKNIVLLGESAVVGPPPGAPAQQADPDDLWPSLKFASRRKTVARVVPKPETVVKLAVSGASFTTTRHFDLDDPLGDHEDDWR